MRQDMNAKPTKLKREAYGKEWGMNTAAVSLATISPALDWITTRPTDPAHSEYQGMARRSHIIFMTRILTPNAVVS